MTERKRGRPKKSSTGKTAVFSTRMNPELRAKLEEAAEDRGATLSDEIETRLWRSFDVSDVGQQNRAACQVIGEVMRRVGAAAGKPWPDDPWTFDQVLAALQTLFAAWRPPGRSVKPKVRHFTPADADRIGELTAGHLLTDIFFTDETYASGPAADLWLALKRDLGNLAERGNRNAETK